MTTNGLIGYDTKLTDYAKNGITGFDTNGNAQYNTGLTNTIVDFSNQNTSFMQNLLKNKKLSFEDYKSYIDNPDAFKDMNLQKEWNSSDKTFDWKGLLTKDNAEIASDVMSGLAGLGNAYLGYKNYGLANKQLNLTKAVTNRNIANQGQLINNEILDKAKSEAYMQGLTGANADAYINEAKKGFVNVSAL